MEALMVKNVIQAYLPIRLLCTIAIIDLKCDMGI